MKKEILMAAKAHLPHYPSVLCSGLNPTSMFLIKHMEQTMLLESLNKIFSTHHLDLAQVVSEGFAYFLSCLLVDCTDTGTLVIPEI